jgi:Phage derived protein Gp49-like (DUF891)
MKLVRLAKGRWEVLAVLDRRGRCPVLDFLDELNGDLRPARELLNRSLRLYMPLEGPPTASTHLCKPLGDGLFELRRQPKGPKPGVLFFQDGGHRIVCTNAFSNLETTPRSEIELARGLREQYFAARPEIEVVEEEIS